MYRTSRGVVYAKERRFYFYNDGSVNYLMPRDGRDVLPTIHCMY